MKNRGEIYFCAEPTQLVRLDLKDLAPEKRQAIRQLHRRQDIHNLRILLFFTVYAIAAIAALRFDHPMAQIASSIGIICAMVGCTVLLHEASHRSLFKSAAANDLVGFLCGLPVFLPVSGFRTNHRGHHARRGSGVDPDDVAFPRLNKAQSLISNFLVFLVKAYAFVLILPVSVIWRAERRARLQTLLEYGLIAVFYSALFWLFPFSALWKLWLLPLLAGAILTQLRAIAEHGFTTRGNLFTATRTVVSNRCLSFLMCNINYHLEHHLFPAVPWYNLPKLHRLLEAEYRRAGASSYRSYSAFFYDCIKAAWAGNLPNGRLIPAETRHAIGC